MSKALVRLNVDLDEYGQIDWLFVCDPEKIEPVYVKFRDIAFEVKVEEFQILSTDAQFIEQFESTVGVVGENPFPA